MLAGEVDGDAGEVAAAAGGSRLDSAADGAATFGDPLPLTSATPPVDSAAGALDDSGAAAVGNAGIAYRSSAGGGCSLVGGSREASAAGASGVAATPVATGAAGSDVTAIVASGTAAGCSPELLGVPDFATPLGGGAGVPLYSIFSQQPAHVASIHNVTQPATAYRLDTCIDLLY